MVPKETGGSQSLRLARRVGSQKRLGEEAVFEVARLLESAELLAPVTSPVFSLEVLELLRDVIHLQAAIRLTLEQQ